MYRWLLAALPLIFMFGMLQPKPPSVLWWTTGPLDKVRPHDSSPSKTNNPVEISAARNEFESFQIVFRAESQDVDGLDVDISDFKNAKNAVLSKSNVTVYFEGYINAPQPSSIDGKAGEWPDVLIPRVDRYSGEKRNAFPFKLSGQRNQPSWVEMYVPPSTPPGKYERVVSLMLNQSRVQTIPVTLDVWGFDLPSTASFPTSFGINGLTALRQHVGRYTNDDDVIRFTSMYRKAALWHRLSVHNGSMIPPAVRFIGDRIEVDWTNYDREVGPFLDGVAFAPGEPLYGAKATSADIGGVRAIESDPRKTLYWGAFVEHFHKKGWSGRLINYLWDEPKPEDYQELVKRGLLIHTADSSIKNLVAASFRK